VLIEYCCLYLFIRQNKHFAHVTVGFWEVAMDHFHTKRPSAAMKLVIYVRLSDCDIFKCLV